MQLYYPYPSTNNTYKFFIIDNQGHKVQFGAKAYEDFTIHKDEKRKERYILRHRKREDWGNPNTRGYWSRWLLWNKPTLEQSYEDIKKDLKIKGSSSVVKVGTKVKTIRLVPDASDGHNIDCKIDGIGQMKLKSEFVKKA